MPEYEVIVIYEAGLPEEALEREVESFHQRFLAREGAELLDVQRWGKRRLAYEIRKKREGSYVLFRVKGKPTLTHAVDRHLKFAEVVLRHLVVKVRPGLRSRGGKGPPVAVTTEARGEGS